MKLFAPLILLGIVGLACDARNAPSEEDADTPWSSLREMGEALSRAADFAETSSAAGNHRKDADGGRYVSEILLQQLQRNVFADPDYPAFRPSYPESGHVGMVNPDNLYESAIIRPGVDYILRGTRGSTADLVLQVYEANPGVEGKLRSVSTLSADGLITDPGGHFEVAVGPTPREANWLATDATSALLLVRWSHSDWAQERAGRIEIVPAAGLGKPQADYDSGQVSDTIRKAASAVPDAAEFWVDFAARIRLFSLDNKVMKPRETGGQGLAGQVSAAGRFSLEDDEALIVRVPRTDARYQGVQLANDWFDALEWANRQTSLSAGQARLGSDGRYTYVISKADPGVPNWLDTTGLSEGFFFLRFQGLSTPIGDEDAPTAELVALSQLRAQLPSDTPHFSPEDRRNQLADRQLQVQRRFGR